MVIQHRYNGVVSTNPAATRGVRFAPSPTGRFHVGNLRTAWISFQWSRFLNEPWVVRVEDIDGPRVVEGACEQQLADLAALGMVPDRLLKQSDFETRHWDVLLRGVREGRMYPCVCSRKEIREAIDGAASAPHGPVPAYSGRCRELSQDPERFEAALDEAARRLPSLAWRFRDDDSSGARDFIVARTLPRLVAGELPGRQGFAPSYPLACAVDDIDGGYALLVRASDLRDALIGQRAIQRWLGSKDSGRDVRPIPVFHTALIVQEDGHRLEKRTRGVTMPDLADRGVSAVRLREIFEASFDRKQFVREFPADGILAESRERLTTSQLGI